MATTVNLQIGGLCLFVQQSAKGYEGLFALMPAVQHSDPHKTFLVFDRKYAGGQPGKPMAVEIPPGTVVPLRGLSLGITEEKVELPRELATVSKFGRRANGVNPVEHIRPVDKRFTRDAPDPQKLLCRIELDLGLRLEPCGDLAACHIDFPGATTAEKTVNGAGRMVVSFQTNAPFLTIAGTNLFPVSNVIDLGIHNVEASDDVLKPAKKSHEKDEKVAHFHAYYQLLEQPTGPSPKSPRAKEKGEGIDPGNDIPAGPCGVKIRFVDPYRCMAGGGCEDQFTC